MFPEHFNDTFRAHCVSILEGSVYCSGAQTMLARIMRCFHLWSVIMTKYEIMAMMMCNENRFAGDPYTVTAKLAACLETFSDRLSEENLAQLIQIGGAIYQYGIDECKQPVDLEDLFPACENWPVPNPARSGFRNRKH